MTNLAVERRNEKALLIGEGPAKTAPSKRDRKRAIIFKSIVLVIFGAAWIGFHQIGTFIRPPQPGEAHSHAVQLDFEDITPSEKLEWHPCRGSYLCARLTVPMDYHRPLNASPDHPKVHLALLRVPRNLSDPNMHSTSPLLLNPGGPGGSGVFFATFFGYPAQYVSGGLDVIGFDPRGVGATTPRADCFSPLKDSEHVHSSSDFEREDYVTGNFHRMQWMGAGIEVGLINSSNVALQRLDTRARTVAKLCQEKDSLSGKDSIFKYAHTPSVARDMLSIVDAWDEWSASLEETNLDHSLIHKKEQREETIAKSEYPLDTKGKLVYWGVSYGTLLGATFAAMFPDRVGRVVLDGVVDADIYVSPTWSKSLRDTDVIFNSFPKYCHEGESKCALYREGDKLADVTERFQKVLTDLKSNPIMLIDSSKFPVVVTYDMIKSFIFIFLYSPTRLFPLMAEFLNGIHLRDYSLLEQIKWSSSPEEICGYTPPPWAFPTEAQLAIMCSDKRYHLNETVENLESMFEEVSNTSIFADVWMGVMLGCDSWGIEAVDPPMDWNDHPAHKPKPINTSFPLLFLANVADPVTPLYAAVKMARKFVDAGLIEQNSMGHGSGAAASNCTTRKVIDYFQAGKVPPHPVKGKDGRELVDGRWDKCEADEWPFHEIGDWPLTTQNTEETQKERETFRAMKAMQKAHLRMKAFVENANPILERYLLV